MPYLHLPVQSGSDRILAAMNRRHTARRLSARSIERIRAARPDIALSTDFIVGFPGETRRRLRARRSSWSREVGFAQAYSFKYSPRPGTPAAEHGRPGARGGEGRAAGAPAGAARDASRQAFNQRCVGQRSAVLFEQPGRHPGQLVGRVALSAGGACSRPTALHRRDRDGCELRGAGANSLLGRIGRAERRSRPDAGRQAFVLVLRAEIRSDRHLGGRH